MSRRRKTGNWKLAVAALKPQHWPRKTTVDVWIFLPVMVAAVAVEPVFTAQMEVMAAAMMIS